MKSKDYISSGAIDLYATGTLPAEEVKAFEQALNDSEEMQEELRKAQAALELYVAAYARNPRPSLRPEILEAMGIQPDRSLKKSVNEPRLVPYAHVVTYRYLNAAALAALLISTFASWFFFSRWDEAEQRYTDALKKKNEIVQNYSTIRVTLEQAYGELLILHDPTVRVFSLFPLDSLHHGQMRVYWNPYTRQTYLDAMSTEMPADGFQYQLWAQAGSLQLDAGLFSGGDEDLERMKDISNSENWMVTLEPKGGSPVPTMSSIVFSSHNK
jgi:anti-sigma-K factor RskA